MPDKDDKREVAHNVRDQFDNRIFRRAMRSGFRAPATDERFQELLDQLEQSEKRQT